MVNDLSQMTYYDELQQFKNVPNMTFVWTLSLALMWSAKTINGSAIIHNS